MDEIKSNFIYKQQPKPTPHGLKMIAIVDSTNGYFFAEVDTRIPGLAKEKLILDLLDGKNLENRAIVMDRGEGTRLCAWLRNWGKKGDVVGTIKRYRNLPSEIRKIFQSKIKRQNDKSSIKAQ